MLLVLNFVDMHLNYVYIEYEQIQISWANPFASFPQAKPFDCMFYLKILAVAWFSTTKNALNFVTLNESSQVHI